jgi:hypothetical protein
MLCVEHYKKFYACGHWSVDLWSNSWQGQEMCLFSKASSLALRPTHPHIPWVIGAFPQAGKSAEL